MQRINNRACTRAETGILKATSEMENAQDLARATPEARNAIARSYKLAARIRQATKEAKSIEELIHLEMVMQRLDKAQAKTKQDRAGVENAGNGYLALADNVGQLRENPAEYFRANTGNAELRRNIHKIPDWR